MKVILFVYSIGQNTSHTFKAFKGRWFEPQEDKLAGRQRLEDGKHEIRRARFTVGSTGELKPCG